MTDIKTFKHLFEYEGHDFLMETTLEFRQISFDIKDGFVPMFISQKIRQVDLTEPYEDEDEEQE